MRQADEGSLFCYKMKYAIISDIHANPLALTRVLEECDRMGVGQIVCAGDVVGYGPDPVAAIRILRERNIPTVMGNHDAAVAGLLNESVMIANGRAAVLRHRAELDEADVRWLRSLPYVCELGGFAVAHAGFYRPEEMRYTFDKTDARSSFVHRSESLLFIGHTHIEALFAFGLASDPKFPECMGVPPRDFRMVAGWQYMVNVGSLGYPRDRRYSSFVTFDADSQTVRYHRAPFDFEAYAESLRERSLPIPPWVLEYR